MIIRGEHGQKIYLEIEGDKRNDDNWLIVKVNVQLKAVEWKASDRCLRLSEFKELIEWFETIERNEEMESDYLEFLEPEISFKFCSKPNEQLKTIQLFLSYNLLPNNLKKEQSIEFLVSKKELKRIIKDLKNEVGSK